MFNKVPTICVVMLMTAIAACTHPKTKPISKDISRMIVPIAGKSDSVINNREKNYGNATVSEPCVKCLLQVIQQTDSYKKSTSAIRQKNVIYNINWITSTKPMVVGDGTQIINGMQIDVNEKTGNSTKKLTTYLYNNQNAYVYLQNGDGKFAGNVKVADTLLKKIRNSCFWGVASAK